MTTISLFFTHLSNDIDTFTRRLDRFGFALGLDFKALSRTLSESLSGSKLRSRLNAKAKARSRQRLLLKIREAERRKQQQQPAVWACSGDDCITCPAGRARQRALAATATTKAAGAGSSPGPNEGTSGMVGPERNQKAVYSVEHKGVGNPRRTLGQPCREARTDDKVTATRSSSRKPPSIGSPSSRSHSGRPFSSRPSSSGSYRISASPRTGSNTHPASPSRHNTPQGSHQPSPPGSVVLKYGCNSNSDDDDFDRDLHGSACDEHQSKNDSRTSLTSEENQDGDGDKASMIVPFMLSSTSSITSKFASMCQNISPSSLPLLAARSSYRNQRDVEASDYSSSDNDSVSSCDSDDDDGDDEQFYLWALMRLLRDPGFLAALGGMASRKEWAAWFAWVSASRLAASCAETSSAGVVFKGINIESRFEQGLLNMTATAPFSGMGGTVGQNEERSQNRNRSQERAVLKQVTWGPVETYLFETYEEEPQKRRTGLRNRGMTVGAAIGRDIVVRDLIEFD